MRCTAICKCGTIKEKILLRSLLSGNTKSCGCLNKEKTVQRNTTHSESKTRLYKIWQGMKRRCQKDGRKDSKYYYQKGIKISPEWESYENFRNWAVNNGYSDKLTIERLNNNKGYTPENCKWIPKSEQSKNRTSNHYIQYNGKTQTLSDWSREFGINRSTLSNRIRKGMTIQQALTKPTCK